MLPFYSSSSSFRGVYLAPLLGCLDKPPHHPHLSLKNPLLRKGHVMSQTVRSVTGAALSFSLLCQSPTAVAGVTH